MAGNLKRAKKGGTAAVPRPAGENGGSKFFALPTHQDGDVMTVAVADISPNPFNERDLGDLEQLKESIRGDGLLQDIAVMHTKVFAEHYPEAAKGIETPYVIAFGERRWRAHQEIGKTEITAVLRDDVAPKIRRVLFTENFHRKQLSPVEEARKFQRMRDEEGMSYREIVEELHLSGPNYVSRRLDLLKLPEALQAIVGTDDGPGVTLARNIGATFATPEEQIQAWELIRDEGITVKKAAQRIHSGEAVPQGNSAPAPTPARPADGKPAAGEGTSEAGKGDGKPPAQAPKAKPAASSRDAADRSTVERNNASADRDAACRHLITSGVALNSTQHDGLFARVLLAPMQQGPARTRAHRWLRDADRAGFAISDTDSYFEAVLSSGNSPLVNLVAIATALAAGEIRAADGRRQWDRTDAEHVRLLIEAANYRPQTAWERGQLTKFGVPFPGADEAPDLEPIR